jgi:hypothetical protein
VKTDTGRTTPEQKQWIESLCSSGQEAHVLHFPRDWHRFDALIAVEPQQLTITNSSSVTDDLSLCGAALQVES